MKVRANAPAVTAAEPTHAFGEEGPHEPDSRVARPALTGGPSPFPVAASPVAADLAAPSGDEAGTGMPMEELLALEALAAKALGSDAATASDEELGFGGFDDD